MNILGYISYRTSYIYSYILGIISYYVQYISSYILGMIIYHNFCVRFIFHTQVFYSEHNCLTYHNFSFSMKQDIII